MAHIIMTHKVADYDKWLAIYDADKPRRDQAGMTELGLYRSAEDPNDLILHFEGKLETIKAMMSDPSMPEKMKEAGVLEEPTVFVGEKTR